MPNTVPAAATCLPAAPATRRTLLAGLAALPAISIPAPAQPSSDAALIAFASKVEALGLRRAAALAHWCKLDSQVDEMVPKRPEAPPVIEAFSTHVEHEADGSMTIRSTRLPVDPEAQRAAEREEREHAAALAAWEAERDAIKERLGLEDAERLQEALDDALYAAAVELTPMIPTTWAGLVAKARVAVALDPKGYGDLNKWEYALMSAVLRDTARIGGAA